MKHAPSTRFLFVRHAQTTWNHEHRYAGSGEVPLAPESVDQIHALTWFLHSVEIDAIYSSPLSRCLETITPVAHHAHRRIIVREELRERNLGEWQGKTADEIHPTSKHYHFPESAYNGELHVPKAELLDELERRVRGLLHELTHAHPGQTVVLATHAGVMWTVLARIVANPPDTILWAGNCAVYRVVTDSERFLVASTDNLDQYSTNKNVSALA